MQQNDRTDFRTDVKCITVNLTIMLTPPNITQKGVWYIRNSHHAVLILGFYFARIL